MFDTIGLPWLATLFPSCTRKRFKCLAACRNLRLHVLHVKLEKFRNEKLIKIVL